MLVHLSDNLLLSIMSNLFCFWVYLINATAYYHLRVIRENPFPSSKELCPQFMKLEVID